ncbi:hypothetical protein V1507DRAFT_210298 [Lipomyces tetrasporus]
MLASNSVLLYIILWLGRIYDGLCFCIFSGSRHTYVDSNNLLICRLALILQFAHVRRTLMVTVLRTNPNHV